MNTPRTVFLILMLVAATQVAYYSWCGQLPERMASHFDGQGNPNGFMSRTEFFIFHLGAVGVVSVVFLLLPALFSRLPTAMINLPRKDYWLAPERKKATLEKMSGHMTWFGSATLLLLIVVMEAAIRANLQGASGRLDSRVMWGAIGSYLAVVLISIVPLIVKYSRPPK